MKCPICYHDDTKVVDSRVAADGLSIRRRRECLKCGFRYSTLEEMEILELAVIKRDGQKESYDRNKIVRGLERAFEKRSMDEDDLKKLIHSIERDIQKTRKNEIESREIGQIIMDHLKDSDTVAYIRFASVYEAFEISDFEEELKKIINKKGEPKSHA
ncbi:transcriptional repressor NrdR [Candidatus Falkowbacteria bacterium]|nr:transcriptional repressor NrdR [Candidatus Falkowbacteria bacterium]